MHAFRAASQYIESLRTPAKKRYARTFYQYLRSKGKDSYPTAPEDLSVMAAQAVRMSLLDVMEPAGYGLPEGDL